MHITFLFYQGMTALDAIGPHEILARLPGASIHRVATDKGPIHSSTGLICMAEQSLSEISHTDILVIPGAGNATTLREHPKTLEWIRLMHSTSTWTSSICTGSLILAEAGLLTGIEATTHWAVMDRLQSLGAIPKNKRVVESGKIITAAGVSAGIDMALTLSAKVAGQQVAESLQLAIEYDPEPPFDAGSPQKANPMIVEALRAQCLRKFESF